MTAKTPTHIAYAMHLPILIFQVHTEKVFSFTVFDYLQMEPKVLLIVIFSCARR